MFMEGMEVKRGDKVYCLVLGNGVVQNVVNEFIYVDFAGKMIGYDKNFRHPRFHARTLYWSDPVQIAPAPSPDDKAATIVRELFKNAHAVITKALEG